jgi:hypothetical protein
MNNKRSLKWIGEFVWFTLFALGTVVLIGFFRGLSASSDTPTGANPTSIVTVSALPNPYAPSNYGLPDTIAGYKVLAVLTADTEACLQPGKKHLILQASQASVEDFLKASDSVALDAALYQAGLTADEVEIGVAGPGATLDVISAEIQKWNQSRQNGCVTSGPAQNVVPTVAPTATPGDPLPLPTSVPLAQPLTTQEQALDQVLRYDASIAFWSQPWSKDTLTSEPGRITIESYPSRTAESAAHGLKEGFAPEIDADAGLVWTISIKGNVRVALISPRVGDSSTIYDGVTYVISQRTGNLLTVRTGLPLASPTPIVEATRITTKSNDLSWLKSRQPMSITWKTLTGTVEAKNVALFHYSFSYPADWFVYPQGIQSFPQFETPDQAPPGFTEGNVKIDVGPIICISPEASASEDCYLTGTPFSVDGAPAFAAAYSDDVVPGLQIRTVDVLKDSVILRMTAFINGKPDRIKTYEQIFGYIISTLKFDP